MRRALLAAAVLGGGGAGLTLGAGPAAAAVCAPGLTVAGTSPNVQGAPLPVTGEDCVVQGDGSITITNPSLGADGRVTMLGTMTLSADRRQMIQNGPQPIGVRVGQQEVLAGPITVKDVTFCDVEPASPGPPFPLAPNSLPEPGPEGGTVGGSVALPTFVNCRLVPGFEINAPRVLSTQKRFGLGIAGRDGKISFLVDDQKGGRIVGLLQVVLPIPRETVATNRAGLGFLVEFSALQSLQLIGGSASYPRGFTVPGTNVGLRSITLTIVPEQGRFGASVLATLPRSFRLGAAFQVANGRLEQLGGVIALPQPGVPILQPPLFFVTGLGFNLDRTGGGGLRTPVSTQQTPTRFTGTIGWRLSDPSGTIGIGGPMNLSFGGPTINLSGDYCLVTPVAPCTVQFGNVALALTPQPFRIEAQHSFNTLQGKIVGTVFVGATLSPFHVTGLGTATAKVPDNVPFVGGTQVASASAAVSEKAAGAVARVNNPFGDDFFIGGAFFWRPFDIKIIRGGLQDVVTVTPTTLSLNERAKGQHDVQTLTLPPSKRGWLLEVVGTTRTPRAIRVTGSGGRIAAAPLPGRAGAKRALFALRGPATGISVQSPDAIATLNVAAIESFPYIQPLPGYGTRNRAPVTAGTPVTVCWKVPNAQPGLTVDLLEDQNGRLGTGRTVAEDLPANGCFAVPTDGLEPGRHWVYGLLKSPDGTPIWARYWPIGITIKDPAALRAPSGLRVRPTADGARVSFRNVAGAGYYLVRAEPTEEGVVKPVETSVVNGSGTDISLRGAPSWRVSVQAIDTDDRRGNITAPRTVTPTKPVVLSGTPNGLAEIGKPWAFQLDVANLTSLRLVSGPRGSRLNRRGLVTWKPSRAAIAKGFVTFTVRGCVGARCVTRDFRVSAFDANRLPLGPIRGFTVLQSVVRPGDTVTLLAQGATGRVRVKFGRRSVPARIVEAETVTFRVPRNARPGSHDISLRFGKELQETVPDAVVIR